MLSHYQHSGRAPLGGLLATLGIQSLLAAIAGMLYTLVGHYVLFLMVLVALPVVLGLCLTGIVGQLARTFAIRNVMVVRILAFAAAFVALYSAWGTTLYGMTQLEDLPATIRTLHVTAFYPQTIWNVGQYLFEHGFFILHEGDEPIHGWALASLWVLEAAIVVGLPVCFAEKAIASEVFCERCEQWVRPHIVSRFLATGEEPHWSLVGEGIIDELNELPRSEPGMRPCVELSVHQCPTCQECNFLSATALTPGPQGHDVQKQLVDRLSITPEQMNLLPELGYWPEYEIADSDELTDEEDSDDADSENEDEPDHR